MASSLDTRSHGSTFRLGLLQKTVLCFECLRHSFPRSFSKSSLDRIFFCAISMPVWLLSNVIRSRPGKLQRGRTENRGANKEMILFSLLDGEWGTTRLMYETKQPRWWKTSWHSRFPISDEGEGDRRTWTFVQMYYGIVASPVWETRNHSRMLRCGFYSSMPNGQFATTARCKDACLSMLPASSSSKSSSSLRERERERPVFIFETLRNVGITYRRNGTRDRARCGETGKEIFRPERS